MAANGSSGGPKPKRTKIKAAEHDELADYIQTHTREFVLAPKKWAEYRSIQPLKWKHVDFNKASRVHVPKERGLYAFAVQPPHTDFPPSSWLFYVGEVGADSGPTRTLWKRYAEYLVELEDNVREKVGRMIYKYRGHVRFYYCVLDPKVVDIKAIESELISALWPYANKRDFNARSSRTKKALR